MISARMSPVLSSYQRKVFLTAHVTSSVGWLGSVVAFLALAGVSSDEADVVRAAYLAMNVLGQFVIVPLGLAAMATGLVQSLGTHWGLFRHYWVVVKFVLTVGATLLLLLHQFTAVAGAAKRAAEASAGGMPEVGGLGPQLVFDAALAIVVLLLNATLSVFKPWGRTPYGQRKVDGVRGLAAPAAAIADRRSPLPVGLKVFLAILLSFLLVVLAVHLAGGGLADHGP
jgi:hypothetical protein